MGRDGSREPVIRAVAEGDVEAVHEILFSPHVVAGSMRVPFSGIQVTRERLASKPGVYQLVAEIEGQVVGFAELLTEPDEPRQRHVGDLNMVATQGDWLGQGVGRALSEAVVELSFNWLNLERVGLIVFTDNAAAIKLYESLGFQHEGTMRRLGYGSGGWMDAHVMGLLRRT
ncbi:MAG: GNAT family N-acetyltransferase [Actinomycetota bacterium]|nr:GNAT family N-acetyltransferase [Actinomycetota bacterium]